MNAKKKRNRIHTKQQEQKLVRVVIVDMRCRICKEVKRIPLGAGTQFMFCPRCHQPYFNRISDHEIPDVLSKIGESVDPASLLGL